MNKVEANLRADGFKFRENNPVAGCLAVERGAFVAYWINDKKTGKMPKFDMLSDGSLSNAGTYNANDYEAFLCAIVTNEFDFVEHSKQVEFEQKKKRLESGGFIQWASCTEEEKVELRKLGGIILHYGGVTTARLKRA